MNWMHKTGSWLQKRLRRVRPAQVVVLSFALLILLGVTGMIQPTFSALLHNASTLAISLRSMTPLLHDAEGAPNAENA